MSKKVGFFSEMKFNDNCGSAADYIVSDVTYDKKKIIAYLEKGKRIAGCPRTSIDCITGEQLSSSFSVYSDGEYDWCDFLPYHIKKYNIKLPKEFIEKIEESYCN